MILSKDNAGGCDKPSFFLSKSTLFWMDPLGRSTKDKEEACGRIHNDCDLFIPGLKLPLGHRGNVAIIEITRSYVPDPSPPLFAMPYCTICTFVQIPARNPIARECGGLPRSDQDLRGCHHAGLCCPTSGNNSLTIGNFFFFVGGQNADYELEIC